MPAVTVVVVDDADELLVAFLDAGSWWFAGKCDLEGVVESFYFALGLQVVRLAVFC